MTESFLHASNQLVSLSYHGDPLFGSLPPPPALRLQSLGLRQTLGAIPINDPNVLVTLPKTT
jgi:hypothetical protein